MDLSTTILPHLLYRWHQHDFLHSLITLEKQSAFILDYPTQFLLTNVDKADTVHHSVLYCRYMVIQKQLLFTGFVYFIFRLLSATCKQHLSFQKTYHELVQYKVKTIPNEQRKNIVLHGTAFMDVI